VKEAWDADAQREQNKKHWGGGEIGNWGESIRISWLEGPGECDTKTYGD